MVSVSDLADLDFKQAVQDAEKDDDGDSDDDPASDAQSDFAAIIPPRRSGIRAGRLYGDNLTTLTLDQMEEAVSPAARTSPQKKQSSSGGALWDKVTFMKKKNRASSSNRASPSRQNDTERSYPRRSIKGRQEILGANSAHRAAGDGDTGYLLSIRASPEQHKLLEERDYGGWTPFHHAASACHIDAMELTYPFAKPLVKREDRTWMIHLAAREGRYDVLELYSLFGWVIDAVNDNNEDVIDAARTCIRQKVEMLVRTQNERRCIPCAPKPKLSVAQLLYAKHTGVKLDDDDDYY